MLLPVELEPATLIFGLALLLVVLLGGYLLGHSSTPRRADTEKDPEGANRFNEMRRVVRRMEQENQDLTLFFVSLPDLIRQLNSNRDKRQIAPLLLRMLELIFEPNQICIFYRAADGERFKLTASKGLPRLVNEDEVEVERSEGRIGWVAEHKVVMDARDFTSASSMRGEDPGAIGRFNVELCAPLVDPDDDKTLGVIGVGGLNKYPRNEKKMIKMVADLGSMGIKNAEYYQRIRTLANEDSLTALYNKRFGADQLSLAINYAEQNNKNLSILLFDIDHFKTYNDTNGHLEGDDVLRSIGQILKASIRADDFGARFGGEEFLVVFHDADKEGAMFAAEKIRQAVEQHPFRFRDRQPGGTLTISGGVATFRTDSRLSTELLRLADEALYRAKKEGRNRIKACRTRYLSAESEGEATHVAPPTT